MKKMKLKARPLKSCSIVYEYVYGQEGLIKEVILNDMKINKGMKNWK